MEDEDDIWDYKSSVGKRKSKTFGLETTNRTEQKSNQPKKKTKNTKRRTISKKTEKEKVISIDAQTPEKQTQTNSQRSTGTCKSSGKMSGTNSSQTPVHQRHEGFCPICQMPFKILPLSPSWHVIECMDCPNADKECPDGSTCDNTIESHYKEYAHNTLALIRATKGSTQTGGKLSAKVRLEFSELPVQSDIAVSVKLECLPKQSTSTITENPDSNKENVKNSSSTVSIASAENVTKIKDKKLSTKLYGSNENIDDIIDDDDDDDDDDDIDGLNENIGDIIDEDNDNIISSPQDISEIIDSMEPDNSTSVRIKDRNDDNENDDLSAILLEELIPSEDESNKNGSTRKRKSLRDFDDVSPKKQTLISIDVSNDTNDSTQGSSGLSQSDRVDVKRSKEGTSRKRKMLTESKRKSVENDLDNVCSQKLTTKSNVHKMFDSQSDVIDLSQNDGNDEPEEGKLKEKIMARTKFKSIEKLAEGVSSQKQTMQSNVEKKSASQRCSEMPDDNRSKTKQSKGGSSQRSEINSTPNDDLSQSTQNQKGKKRLSLSRKKSKTGKPDQNQTSLTAFFKCSSIPSETIAAKVKKEEECFIISDSDSDANVKNPNVQVQTLPLEIDQPCDADMKSTTKLKSPCLLSKKAVQTVRKLVHEAKKSNDYAQLQREEKPAGSLNLGKESESVQSDSSNSKKSQVQKKSALDILMKNAGNNMTNIQEKSDVDSKMASRIRFGPGYMSFSRNTKDSNKSETAEKSASEQSCDSVKPAVTETRGPPITKSSRNTVPKRKCPFYKKIPETGFTVDAFSYGDIPECTGYFLSHFHYDHYNGLTKHFTNPIYCSQITANLVLSRIKVKEEFVHPIPLNTPSLIDNVEITMLEANHCPGSVLILFRLPNGRVILHTGDFRADKSMEDYPEFKGVKFSQLYLDTTYCNPTYDFPPQKEVINFAVDLVKKELARNPKTLIVCGSYTIGKERIFIAIAQALGCKICVYRDKRNVMSCLDDPDLFQKLSLDFNDSQLHVLQLGKLNPKGLGAHMSALQTKYSNVIALEPTGWSYGKINSLQEIKPKYNRDGIKIFGIPYSEHSSYLELKQFVQFIKPERIIPTVNNGNPKSRKKMEDIFKSWFQELQPGQGQQTKVTIKQSSISTWFA